MALDWNDLHVDAGLPEVRRQLMDAIERFDPDNPPHGETSPDPSANGGPGDGLTLERCLERYLLIYGETKIWDQQEKQVIKKVAFRDLVGPKLYKAWNEHEDRRTITKAAVSELQGTSSGILDAMLQRYVYVYPTKEAWDRKKKAFVPLEVMRYAFPNDFDWWMKNPGRETIDQDQVVFDPTQQTQPPAINTFTGLPLKPTYEAGDYRPILELLLSLCNDDAEVCDWLLKWLAYPLQHLGSKMATALLIHSDVQGSGKSLLFADVLTRVYGEYGSVLGQHQLESQYTDWRSRLLYGVFEEVLSRDQKYSHTGTIKHMITGRTQRIEKKFISGWEEANYMNCVFLSNEIQPFPIDPSDRRMMVVWPERTLNPALMEEVSRALNDGAAAAFFQFLLDLDLEGFHAHTKPPVTEAKERLIDFGLPGWEVFYREWESGNLDIPFATCLSGDLHRYYQRWCRRSGDHALSLTKFGAILSTRLRKKKNAVYMQGLKRRQGTFYIMGEKPDEVSESAWLGRCVDEFRQAMANGDEHE